ncbi:MAG: PINc/VapC family ATPase [Candidatus Anstonellales archaeon]
MNYLLDTSIIIDGRIIELIETKEIEGNIYITKASIAELEHQANMNKETGFTGFSVIEKLKSMEGAYNIKIEIVGERPTTQDVIRAKETGAIDASIRAIAKNLNATLITADKVQHLAAIAEGIATIYLRSREKPEKPLLFEKYFDELTMSVHMKEDTPIKIKRGTPGNWKMIVLADKPTTHELREMSEQIIEATKRNVNYYIEIDKPGATVIQMRDYRIVISKPPFSDGFEITIVRPIKKLKLEDYKLDKSLLERLDKEAEGIIIAGPPGSGKTTFATALAEYYLKKGKIVKTMEDPRDMKVSDEITQYTRLDGTYENTKDILLLVRPDYVFFDEVRKTEEFNVYADLRFAGVGLVGVVHANRAIDAIQRFINRVELGVIPQIVDTTIFISDGKPSKIYLLEHTIKVPTGMTERDLARPVIEIKDFYTKQLEYEIYKFGEETVVLPIKKLPKIDREVNKLSSLFSTFLSRDIRVERQVDRFIVYLTADEIKRFFKSFRKRFERLKKKFGDIEIREM